MRRDVTHDSSLSTHYLVAREGHGVGVEGVRSDARGNEEGGVEVPALLHADEHAERGVVAVAAVEQHRRVEGLAVHLLGVARLRSAPVGKALQISQRQQPPLADGRGHAGVALGKPQPDAGRGGVLERRERHVLGVALDQPGWHGAERIVEADFGLHEMHRLVR
jgi:hypothetical protein